MDVVEVVPTCRAVRVHLRRGRPAAADHAGDGAAAVVRRRVRRRAASVDDLSSEKVDLRFVNPQTGPFYVEGAEPGDTLALHLVALEPARDWGASAAIPFFGGLTSTDRVGDPAGRRCPTPPGSTSWTGRGTPSRSPRGTATCAIELPVEPMLGTVGVAPAGGEVRSSLVPDRFGGNMDTPQMRAGATCFLGVNVEGALFSIGDGHYRQGEGEACGTAVEGAMTTTLIVELIKGGAPGLAADRGRHALDDRRARAGRWRTPGGSARPSSCTGSASSTACTRWTPTSCSRRSREVPIANVVDANYSAVVKAPQGAAARRDAPTAACTPTCAPARRRLL